MMHDVGTLGSQKGKKNIQRNFLFNLPLLSASDHSFPLTCDTLKNKIKKNKVLINDTLYNLFFNKKLRVNSSNDLRNTFWVSHG